MSTLLGYWNCPDPNKHKDYWHCPTHNKSIVVESQYGKILWEKETQQDESPFASIETYKEKSPKE